MHSSISTTSGSPRLATTSMKCANGLPPPQPDWLPSLFPQARLSADRKSLRCADLSGRPPRNEGSCVIHLRGPRAGWGYDHATGECAGPIDLIHHSTGLTNAALFEEAARRARLDRPAPPRSTAPAKADHSHEIARILAGCTPLAGSVAERYLQSRGLRDPASPGPLVQSRPRRLRDPPRLARHGGASPRRRRRADRRNSSYLSARRRFGQSPAGQEDARRRCRRLGPPFGRGRRRTSRSRRGHRDGARRTDDFRRFRPGPRSPPTGCDAGSGRTASTA